MRTLTRRVLPVALLLAASFLISYAVADAGGGGGSPARVVVPGVAPTPVGQATSPRVKDLSRAAALPGLRVRRKKAAPAPVAPVTRAPARVTPAPTPTRAPAPTFTPAPAPVPVTPAPAPAPKPKGKKFKSIG